MYQRRYGTTSGSYPDLDRFGRVIASRWTKDLATDMDFVSVSVGYDENSNPLTTEENIFDTGFDVKYAIDGLDRVTDADEGTLSGGNITSQTRRQQWTLSQTGNWDAETLDLNGAASGYGTNGRTETRTHNLVNELTSRSVTTDGGGPTTKNLVYDAAGNLTDDGETYAYEYDAWHRLRKIKDRGTSAVLSEHQYYGNGFRSGERYDADDDGTIDTDDPWYWFGYDERWRIVATFIGSDASPKERFLHHTAGAGGYGTSSYIDQVVLRERDANTAWHLSSDGTLEERLYYCQNWRHDVVALVTANGQLRERIRYSSYGIPFGQPLGDCDGDGDVDAANTAILLGAWGTNTPKCDLDLSGTIDATDQSILLGNSGATSGFGELTRNRNRLGCAGYAADGESAARWHVRHRVLESELGRWTRRDPLGYVAGSSLYEYVQSSPSARSDPTGLIQIDVCSGTTCGLKQRLQSESACPPETCWNGYGWACLSSRVDSVTYEGLGCPTPIPAAYRLLAEDYISCQCAPPEVDLPDYWSLCPPTSGCRCIDDDPPNVESGPIQQNLEIRVPIGPPTTIYVPIIPPGGVCRRLVPVDIASCTMVVKGHRVWDGSRSQGRCGNPTAAPPIMGRQGLSMAGAG